MPEELPRLTPLTADEISSLRARQPDLPADYTQFLASRGWGQLPGGPMLYSGPVQAEDVFGARSVRLPQGVVLIGDDLAGTSFGFDTVAGWLVVAIDASDINVVKEADSFADFVRSYEHDYGA